MVRRSNLPDIWRGGGSVGPFREINRLQRRIDQMFDDFMNTSLTGVTGPGFLPWTQEGWEPGQQLGFLPPCDIEETDNQYLVSFDLPGMRKEDLKIELRDNQLTVSGERRMEHEGEGGRGEQPGAHARERYYGTFLRSFTLPQEVDPSKVDAVYENGVLQIAIPKIEARPGHRITVKEGRLLGQRQPEQRGGQQPQAAGQRKGGRGGEAA